MGQEILLLASDGSPGALDAADWVQGHWCTADRRVIVVVVAVGSSVESHAYNTDQPNMGVLATGNATVPLTSSAGIGGMWMLVPQPTEATQNSYPSHLVEAHAQLHATTERLHGFSKVQGMVQSGQGHVVDGILAAIEDTKPTLVVVGRRGLNRLERWVVGSVSQSILGRSTVPVLVIPLLDLPPESSQNIQGAPASEE